MTEPNAASYLSATSHRQHDKKLEQAAEAADDYLETEQRRLAAAWAARPDDLTADQELLLRICHAIAAGDGQWRRYGGPNVMLANNVAVSMIGHLTGRKLNGQAITRLRRELEALGVITVTVGQRFEQGVKHPRATVIHLLNDHDLMPFPGVQGCADSRPRWSAGTWNHFESVLDTRRARKLANLKRTGSQVRTRHCRPQRPRPTRPVQECRPRRRARPRKDRPPLRCPSCRTTVFWADRAAHCAFCGRLNWHRGQWELAPWRLRRPAALCALAKMGLLVPTEVEARAGVTANGPPPGYLERAEPPPLTEADIAELLGC